MVGRICHRITYTLDDLDCTKRIRRNSVEEIALMKRVRHHKIWQGTFALIELRQHCYRRIMIIAARTFLLFCLYLGTGLNMTYGAERWQLIRQADTFNRYFLTKPVNHANAVGTDPCIPKNTNTLQNIRTYHNLAGAACGSGYNSLVTGWFEYDVEIPKTGWYELRVDPSNADVDYIIDPKLHDKNSGGLDIYGSSGSSTSNDKISNLWLSAGKHTLRLQRFFWTGFPAIRNFTIRASKPALSQTIRTTLSSTKTIFRMKQCAPLDIFSGETIHPDKLTVWFKDTLTGAVIDTLVVDIPATSDLWVQQKPIFCGREGNFTIVFGNAAGHPISNLDIREINYEVINTRQQARYSKNLKKILVQEINCATTAPDYYGGGETRVVKRPFGSYRESGDVGWIPYQILNDRIRRFAPEPSWFAYRLDINQIQQPYLIEVDYPDDAERTFAIVLRESKPLMYPVAGGIDSGGEFSLSNKLFTHSLLFWPRARDPRITFLTAKTGMRAAAARIRVYKIDKGLPALDVPKKAGRNFVNWYEEGENFASIYGAPDETASGLRIATERWMSAAAYMGVNVLSPSVAVYGSSLFPSRYNREGSVPPTNDIFRMMLLLGEKHGMKILPDLHPRADELAWRYSQYPDPKPNLLVSKDGKTLSGFPFHYNPIYPANQEWYIRMIGELVDNYKDSPALLGVSLRLMQWQNPTLNNFQSLNWGYDDYTVSLFEKETGLTIPGADNGPDRFHKRYEWLMNNAKEKWISWRCEKMAQLYKSIRDRVRAARPDLKVFVVPFITDKNTWLRDAGIDPDLLEKINGMVVLNAMNRYGRVFDTITNQVHRDSMMLPDVAKTRLDTGKTGKFLTTAYYFEITDAVLPPESLGWPKNTKKTWTSAVINPSGRHFLERYAVELADTDATWLGDGGNGYTLGQPYLREFMQEYRALPPVPFTPRQDARDPVAVWELARKNDYLFYAVNKERFPVSLQIQLSGHGSIYRLSTHAPVDSKDNLIHLDLKPYQLMAFGATTGMRIAKVTETIPEPDLARITKQIHWLERINDDVQSELIIPVMPMEQRHELRQITQEAKAALDRGWVWRARMLIENHKMLLIYKIIGSMPPDLRSAREDD